MMKEDDKRRWDRVRDSHFRSMYIIVRMGPKSWEIGAKQRDQMAREADAIGAIEDSRKHWGEVSMPYVWEKCCHCCGKTFHAAMTHARYCGQRCRKRAARRGVARPTRANRKWFRTEFLMVRPKWVFVEPAAPLVVR